VTAYAPAGVVIDRDDQLADLGTLRHGRDARVALDPYVDNASLQQPLVDCADIDDGASYALRGNEADVHRCGDEHRRDNDARNDQNLSR
jgi:hypothetical protein